jgi:hypothetical protein
MTKKHNDQLQNQHKQQKLTVHAQKHNTKKNKTKEENNTIISVVISTPILIRSGLYYMQHKAIRRMLPTRSNVTTYS